PSRRGRGAGSRTSARARRGASSGRASSGSARRRAGSRASPASRPPARTRSRPRAAEPATTPPAEHSNRYGVTTKLAALKAVPPAVTTETLPLVAPAGTTAVIWWSESTLGLVAATPPNLTAVTSVKPEPVIVTLVPTGPLPGLREVIFGSTRNVPALWPEPEGVTTVSLPVEASAGTKTVIAVAVTVAGVAGTPSKRTLVAPVKALPPIVTFVPTGAAEGLKEATRGSTSSVAALVAVPPAVVTEIGPSVAPPGTVSRSSVRERRLKLAATPFTLTELTPPKPVP